jgi:nickel/cobalt exporter
LWKKLAPRLAGTFGRAPAHSLSAAGNRPHVHGPNCGHSRLAYGGTPRAASIGGFSAEVCETCGHSHVPDPAMLVGDRFDWRTAWSAVAAVGLRPCSGALIVLTFAFLNGLWAGGVLSVLAMAVGTAITVSILATLAVTAKNVAVSLAGDGRAGNRIHAAIEIGGASLVMLLGLVLLTASLQA